MRFGRRGSSDYGYGGIYILDRQMAEYWMNDSLCFNKNTNLLEKGLFKFQETFEKNLEVDNFL